MKPTGSGKDQAAASAGKIKQVPGAVGKKKKSNNPMGPMLQATVDQFSGVEKKKPTSDEMLAGGRQSYQPKALANTKAKAKKKAKAKAEAKTKTDAKAIPVDDVPPKSYNGDEAPSCPCTIV